MNETKNKDLRPINIHAPNKSDISKYFELIMGSVHDVISISNLEKGFVYITPSVEKETGWFSKELNRKTVFDLAHEDDKPGIVDALSHLDKEREVTFEWRSITKPGIYSWVETKVRKVYYPIDNCEYRVSTTRNIQQRKELQAQILKTTEELSALNNMKDKLLSLIAHDLKSPLFTLITVTEFMQQKISQLSQADMSEFIQQVNDSAKNSYILLENLLEWASSQSGALEFKPERVKLERVILECWKLNQSQANHKNISFSMQVPPDMYIQADYKMLSAIIRNLINNAIKFTPEHGQITISAFMENEAIKLVVEDTGIGMSREQLTYLFTVDARKQFNGVPSQHGSGLGLILCKEFMDKHNGTIDVASKIGQGSKFILTLP